MASRYTTRLTGFSLVEIMIVVTILGIIGALAAPMLSPNHTTKLRAAASILAADLDACRAESITHGQDPRLIVFDTDNHTYHLAPTSDPTSPIAHPTSGGDYTINFGTGDTAQLQGVTLHALDVGGDDQLGFGLYGQLDQPTDATLTLASGGTTITLTLDAPTGEVTIGELE